MRKLLSLLIFRLPGVVFEHNVGGELMTSLATLTVKSEYNAFIVCRMIPDDATYSCRPSMRKVFGKGAGSCEGGVYDILILGL